MGFRGTVMIRHRHILSGMLLAAVLGLSISPALADDDAKSTYSGGLKLVWGSLPFSEFRGGMGSAGSVAAPRAYPAPGFAMTFSLPDDPGERFLFSPRVLQLGPDLAAPTGSRAYLGLGVSIGSTSGLYGAFGLGGSVLTNPVPSFEDSSHRVGNAPLLLHGGFEFGYHLTDRQSLSINLDRAAPPDTLDRGDAIGSMRLRYGLKF